MNLRLRLLRRFRRVPPPPWPHRPDPPRDRAESCACGQPIGDSPSGDWCSPQCHATYVVTGGEPIYPSCPVPWLPAQDRRPPPDPAWLAAWDEHSQRLAEERKSAKESAA